MHSHPGMWQAYVASRKADGVDLGSWPKSTELLKALMDKEPLSGPLHPPVHPPQGAQNSRKGQGLAGVQS